MNENTIFAGITGTQYRFTVHEIGTEFPPFRASMSSAPRLRFAA